MTIVTPSATAERPIWWQGAATNALYVFVCATVIIESLIGYTTGNYELEPTNHVALREAMLAVYLPTVFVLVLLTSLSRSPSIANIKLSPWIAAATVAFAVSCILNRERPTPLVIAGPLLAKFIFYRLRRVPLSLNLRWISAPFVAFTVAPILIWLFYPDLRGHFVFHDNTFRGFGASRADFGYLLGVAAVLLACERSTFLKLFLPVVLYGVWLTESRATLVGLGITLPILAWYYYRRQFVSIALAAVLLLPVLLFTGSPRPSELSTTREDFLINWGGRFGLIHSGIVTAVDRGMLFGSGRLYVNVTTSGGSEMEVHDAAVQSIVNFGLIVTIIWYVLIGRAVRRMYAGGKALVLFLVIFGLFQPGYEPWFFAPQVLFTFLLAECASREGGLELDGAR